MGPWGCRHVLTLPSTALSVRKTVLNRSDQPCTAQGVGKVLLDQFKLVNRLPHRKMPSPVVPVV